MPDAAGRGYRGALFQINARGEPVEFTYNRVETPEQLPLAAGRPAPRRAAHPDRLAARTACPRVPRVIYCLAAEMPSELFCQEIETSVLVCRIAASLETTSYSTLEAAEVLERPAPLHLFWFPAPAAVARRSGS